MPAASRPLSSPLVTVSVEEHHAELDGLPVFWRSGDGADGTPVLYVHGVPTNSDDWTMFLERSGGIAPDLPGFGRSGKPADFEYSISGFAAFLERFLALVGVERIKLVVHDWGAVGLAFAQRFPERIERLVVIDALPLLAGYRWHRIARGWRTPGLGELMMGATVPRVLRLITREANATPGPLPDEMLRSVIDHFDHGTQRAILRLYRSAPPDVLAAAGAELSAIGAPALVVWGDQDPYVPARFADAYARALGGPAEVLHLLDAGHWPWLDRPDLVEHVVGFLAA
jgi:pimeloyl-ACP methyl ester carboxylesterase